MRPKAFLTLAFAMSAASVQAQDSDWAKALSQGAQIDSMSAEDICDLCRCCVQHHHAAEALFAPGLTIITDATAKALSIDPQETGGALSTLVESARSAGIPDFCDECQCCKIGDAGVVIEAG